MTTTIDTLLANARAAKAWRPVSACVNAVLDVGAFRCSEGKDSYDAEDDDGTFCSVPVSISEWCSACLGAQRAVDDIANHIYDAQKTAHHVIDHGVANTRTEYGLRAAELAARIAAYFASEPNPVSIFRDAVKETCKCRS